MDNTIHFNQILSSFGIKAYCLQASQVDNYMFYDCKLQPSAKVKDLIKYSDEISLALKKPCRPSMKVIHELGIVRVEFALPREKSLRLFELFHNHNIPSDGLNCLLGRKVDGGELWMDILQNPHMLIAGTTGSGKSTLLHNIIANIFNYNDATLILMDPKRIEFSQYENVRGTRLCYTYDSAIEMLSNLIDLMEDRYNNIRAGFNPRNLKPVLVIIDEFADLIMQDKGNMFFEKLCRLAQKSRAARISIIISTQRPSVNFVNGAIKANFPARVACKVASHVDSKVVLDTSGAENLLGKGDALLRDNFRHMERFQIAYTDAMEVCKYFGE